MVNNNSEEGGSLIYYKFCSLNEWTMHNLYYNNIYFSKIDFLNDSSELSLNYIDDTPNRDEIKEEVLGKLVSFLKGLSSSKHYDLQVKTLEDIKDIGEGKEKLGKQEISDKERFSLLFLGCIGECYKTSSFTVRDSILNPIMWGHYANNSSGICIGYELDESDLLKIEYIESDKVPRITTSEIIHSDVAILARKIISNKYKDWSYEKEYRMIMEDEIYNLKDGAVKELVFGYKADLGKVRFAIDLAKQRNPELTISIVIPTKSDYKMEKIEVDEESIEGLIKVFSSSLLSDKYLMDYAVAKQIKLFGKLDN